MVPRKDSELAAFSTNFNTRIVASAATYKLSSAQVSAYTPLHEGFIDAWTAVNTPGARSAALVAAKDTAKNLLLPYARELYGLVQANTTVSDSDKILLGVVVRSAPTPIPPPAFSPVVDIKEVDGHTVTFRIHGPDDLGRGLPDGVDGIAVFSYVSEEMPTNPAVFKFEANTTKTLGSIVFADSVLPGKTVWITAMYFNERKESGPAATPVSTVIQFGGMSMAA